MVKLERESELSYDAEYERLTFEDTYRRKYLYYKFGGESPGGEHGKSGSRISIVENPEVVAAREARKKKKESKVDGQFQNTDSPGVDKITKNPSTFNTNTGISASGTALAASRRGSTTLLVSLLVIALCLLLVQLWILSFYVVRLMQS